MGIRRTLNQTDAKENAGVRPLPHLGYKKPERQPEMALGAEVVRRGNRLPSRVLLAPINTGFARYGTPTDDLLDYHRERSAPSIGISILGNVAVHETGTSNATTAVLSDVANSAAYARIAEAIHQRGSLAGIQLGYAPPLNPGRNWRVRDKEAELARLSALIELISARDLDRVLMHFLTSVRLAAMSGFDVVQIHAAHGYLLSILLSGLVNRRSDRYRLEGPWLEEFLSELRARLGNSLLSVRISLFSGARSLKEELVPTKELIGRLSAIGVDIIDLSAGFYTIDRRLIYPNRGEGGLPYYGLAKTVADSTTALVAFAGNVTDLRQIPGELPPNLLVSVGRAFIADPEFATKSLTNQNDRIRWCARTSHCHYFSRGLSHIQCGVNPELGKERGDNDDERRA